MVWEGGWVVVQLISTFLVERSPQCGFKKDSGDF